MKCKSCYYPGTSPKKLIPGPLKNPKKAARCYMPSNLVGSIYYAASCLMAVPKGCFVIGGSDSHAELQGSVLSRFSELSGFFPNFSNLPKPRHVSSDTFF